MIDQLAFVISVGSLFTGMGVAAAAVIGRYRWRWSAPALAAVQLAVCAQVGVAVAGLVAGHRPGSMGVHLAYLVVAVLVVPAVAAQVLRDDTRWAGLLVAVGLLVLAVVVVRAQTTWRTGVACGSVTSAATFLRVMSRDVDHFQRNPAAATVTLDTDTHLSVTRSHGYPWVSSRGEETMMSVLSKPRRSRRPSTTEQTMQRSRRQKQDQQYDASLRRLSEGSVNQHFEPFVDIDWENPDFAVRHDDKRWILSESTDPLGRHPWYKALPEERKIEIGLWRQANVAKVGLQFEQVLMGGVFQYIFKRPNGSAEFRYLTHEVIEECNHTLMFQEMVNRIGVDVPGASRSRKVVAPFLTLAGTFLPEAFFVGVLAGEEPIDHIQKSMLRSGDEVHPIMREVMRIHVAEEARHISFAHQYLQRRIPRLNKPRRMLMSVLFPLIMRTLCDVIVIPPKAFWETFDIPQSVKDEIFWDSPDGQETLRGYFGDVRALAEECGLMNPVSQRVWKRLNIDGQSTRFRSEPDRSASHLAA